MGLVEGRSSWARAGVSIHLTAPKIDPGFDGTIALEMANVGTAPVRLVAIEDTPAQLMFLTLSSPLKQAVVYSASGMHLAAAIVEDTRGVVEHSLYWATVSTMEEADFLCAILNSAAVTQLVRPLMSYGKDERHIDKYVWELPIPEFDAADEEHAALARLGKAARSEAQALELDQAKHFVALRRALRKHLESSETGQAIEQRVVELLG